MIYYGPFVQGPLSSSFSRPPFNVNYPVQIRRFPPNAAYGYRNRTTYNHGVISRSSINTDAISSAPVSGVSKIYYYFNKDFFFLCCMYEKCSFSPPMLQAPAKFNHQIFKIK